MHSEGRQMHMLLPHKHNVCWSLVLDFWLAFSTPTIVGVCLGLLLYALTVNTVHAHSMHCLQENQVGEKAVRRGRSVMRSGCRG